MAKRIRRIAINTGGGDAPGLNAVIRAIVLSALRRGWEVVGLLKGYEGLLDTTKTRLLDRESVRGITHLGGTILGTTNKGHPFEFPTRAPNGEINLVDRSDDVVANFKRLGLLEQASVSSSLLLPNVVGKAILHHHLEHSNCLEC